MVNERQPKLSPDDWTGAALLALAEGGLSAVAIEPLASRLGTTKGSGYWHFANRAALVEATLLRWERDYTEQVIEHTAQPTDPTMSLRHLLRAAIHRAGPQSVEMALLAASADPSVAPVLRRVTERRLGYLTELFLGLDFDEQQARRRALRAYSTYLGYAQLARTAPDLLPAGDEIDAVLTDLLDSVTAR